MSAGPLSQADMKLGLTWRRVGRLLVAWEDDEHVGFGNMDRLKWALEGECVEALVNLPIGRLDYRRVNCNAKKRALCVRDGKWG